MTTALLSPIFEHLWQSTLMAAVAALLAFSLRNNRAQVRYWVWLTASLKFLLPFSLLIAIGSHIHWPAEAQITNPTVSAVAQQMSHSFEIRPFFLADPASPGPRHAAVYPAVLFAVWLCGSLGVLLNWARQWMRVRAAVTASARLSLETAIPAFSSSSMLEPGVFGIFRPVLLIPTGISSHLNAAHLDAILAHELCHVRRRDNLAAAFHMLVQAFFWFHPIVWWIGERLVEERERACDEEVLRLGNQPGVYAESILKTCQFYLQSPLDCVAGVTGSDLKARIARIMTGEMVASLNVGKKFLLAFAATMAVALPLAIGGAQLQPQASFEVATIKLTKPGSPGIMFRMQPGGKFSGEGVNVKFLLEEAYNVKDAQIADAPAWIDSDKYDIEAKPEESIGAAFDNLPPDQRHDELMQMIQGLLAERFKLVLGHDTKELPIYAMIVAKGGLKLKPSSFIPPDKLTPPQPIRPGGPLPGGGIWAQGPGKVTSTGVELKILAGLLSRNLGRIVVDKTGLTGMYDFTLQWTPDQSEGAGIPGGPSGAPAGAPAQDNSAPSLFTALQEQLGLKLESQKVPMDILVIKHVEKPSEN